MISMQEHPPEATYGPTLWRISEDKDASLAQVSDWLHDNLSELNQRILAGGLIVRGFEQVVGPADFNLILKALGSTLMDYIGGTSPRSAVLGKIMSATNLPPEFSLPLHQEMSYTHTFPSRVYFFCERPPQHGGATTLGDMRAFTRGVDPNVRQRFEERGGVQLRRTLPSPSNCHKKPGVVKPWTEVFETEDTSTVDRVAAERGWRTSWLDDESVQLWQEVCPALISHPVTGETFWFNQAHYFCPAASMAWARNDHREEDLALLERTVHEAPEMLDRMFHADGSEVNADDVLYLLEAYERLAVDHQWQRGDLIFLDNIVTAHGRRPFRGHRSILAALEHPYSMDTKHHSL